MSRHVVRLVTGVLVAGSVALGFVPLASAETSSTTLTPSTEAWYQPNPTCAQASGCITPGALPVAPPVDVPLSPYPAGTLHVAWAGGQETARSYLALPVDSVTGTLTAASLDIPLDTAAADGSEMPETAKLQACLFTTDVTPVEGSIAPPPTASCDQSAPVTYVATPSPHLHADLAPLTQGLLTTTGIVLLPDATKNAQTDAWRVVFSAHTRTDAAKTAPATVSLTLEQEASGDDGTVDVPTEPAIPQAVAPPIGTGFAAPPPVQLPTDTGTAPSVVPPATVLTQPVAQPRTITVGYAYPTVWLLPLAFLVLVPATARALTKDLAPAL